MSQLQKDIEYIDKKFNPKKFFMNKNILITGSAGFIGFLMSEYFIKKQKKLGYKKLFLTDINQKYLKKKIKKKFVKKMKFDVIKDRIEKITPEKLDIIIHAASIASPSIYRKYPLKTAEANVVGLRKILEYSKKKKSKKGFIFFIKRNLWITRQKKYSNIRELQWKCISSRTKSLL